MLPLFRLLLFFKMFVIACDSQSQLLGVTDASQNSLHARA